MRREQKPVWFIFFSCFLAGLGLLYLQGLRLLNNEAFSTPQFAWQVVWVVGVLAGVQILRLSAKRHTGWLLWPTLIGLIGVAVVYALNQNTPSAWMLSGAMFAGSIYWANRQARAGGVLRWLAASALAGSITAASAVLVAQIEGRFSEEEFFAALQVAGLVLLWGILWAADRLWVAGRAPVEGLPSGAVPISVRKPAFASILLVILGLSLGGLGAVRAYQTSFYDPQAPTYPGISDKTPFLCGQIQPDPQTYAGLAVFHQLLDRLAANPSKGTNEYALLALTAEQPAGWESAFHDQILMEARQASFTGPSGSVKYGQCEAAQRVYYYARVKSAFPSLFTPQETGQMAAWFGAINRRALTVEPIDWMYALAFTKIPSGPYENQECGAALLAELEVTGLADPALHDQNRSYLDQNRRGWEQRFRNNDDSYIYQVEWLRHAQMQADYSGAIDPRLQRQSFEWYLLQALPDGSPLNYNHVFGLAPEMTAYWAAELLNDPNYLWLAGRSAEWLASSGDKLYGRAPMQKPVSFSGTSPSWGSCLLYGNSGLPNQIGPLAPDKIVFRDGWNKSDQYLLLNLRFTGWHRYKGTNSVVLFYQEGPLVQEINKGQPFKWLPAGRALFRDKRIPRQNLNGLLLGRTGFSAVLYELTSIGSAWTQDPPYLARVESFSTGPEMDQSVTWIEGWHGWQQRRSISFYHSGPVVIYDKAAGPGTIPAALAWHVIGNGNSAGPGRVQIREGEQPAEALFIPLDSGSLEAQLQVEPDPQAGVAHIRYQAPQPGRISLATIFLTGEWVGAQASLTEAGTVLTLHTLSTNQTIEIPLTH